ncbi:MAG: electron transfer flavoprotein subunit alpha/FixB family protein [Thermodesulfobacteriota bacterium]|nr:electron transfer flavoprotein subunit alpha/FixB family protein [Thermodesulfobacteriota bacterium]
MPTTTLLVADTINNTVTSKSRELAGVACVLAPDAPESAVYVLAGEYIVQAGQGLCQTTGLGAIALEGPDFRFPNPEALASAVCSLPELETARHICFLHTPGGCQVAAKVAVKIGAACISAVENIRFESDQIILKRAFLNGKLKMETRPGTERVVMTIMPGGFAAPKSVDQGPSEPRIEQRQTDAAVRDERYTPCTLTKTPEADTGLDKAAIIVAAGRGIGDEDNIDIIHSLARTLPNAAVAASRPLCDMKWLPYAHQVGITGKTVAPRLYIACGISGAQQHVQGMKDSQCIVAVNTDPNAAIFSVADYCIVEDLTLFIPAFIKAYQAFLSWAYGGGRHR